MLESGPHHRIVLAKVVVRSQRLHTEPALQVRTVLTKTPRTSTMSNNYWSLTVLDRSVRIAERRS